MNVRFKKTPAIIWYSSQLNIHSLSEVIVQHRDFGADSVDIEGLDVLIKNNWKDMRQAFRDHDLITDNYNTIFFEARDEKERKRGYAL